MVGLKDGDGLKEVDVFNVADGLREVDEFIGANG